MILYKRSHWILSPTFVKIGFRMLGIRDVRFLFGAVLLYGKYVFAMMPMMGMGGFGGKYMGGGMGIGGKYKICIF